MLLLYHEVVSGNPVIIAHRFTCNDGIVLAQAGHQGTE
jgi:hypothetical protein